MEGNSNSFFLQPFDSGFLTLLIGGLGLLMVYHLFLFFQNKERTYLLYALYLFFIILSQCSYLPESSLSRLFDGLGRFKYYSVFYTEASYLLYFMFAYRFLEIKEDFSKVYHKLRLTLYLIAGFSVLHTLSFYFLEDRSFDLMFYNVFVLVTLVLSIISYIYFFRSKRAVKYYLISGSIVLLVFSFASLFSFGLAVSNGESGEASYSILYVGFILENLIFSLGLGRKQKILQDQRNEVQTALIKQMKENEQLEAKLRARQESEILRLTERLEEDTTERLAVYYQKELAELKLASLRNQMNPHFIFNSLNSIKGFIIDHNQDEALFYLNKFSKLIRKILSSSIEKEITLAEEVEIAELYLQLENIRYDNSIDIQIEVEPELAVNTIKVPALIVQPFLENAIWHGLALKEGEKWVLLQLSEVDGQLEIVIEDNGIGRSRSKEIKNKKITNRRSYGIKLTEDRLRSYEQSNGGKALLEFEDLIEKDGSPSGTRVRMVLPVISPITSSS